MAYSTEEREAALIQCAEGLTNEEVSAKLGISKYSIENWKRLLFTTGSLEKKITKNKPRKAYKYTREKIIDLLEKSKISKDLESAKTK